MRFILLISFVFSFANLTAQNEQYEKDAYPDNSLKEERWVRLNDKAFYQKKYYKS